YMLHKCWTGAYCRYFREAVLPLNPELQASLTTEGISPELRACAVCGKAFLPEGRQAYCSDACKAEGNRRKSRERMRKMREKRPGGCYDLPPPKA
ncbi:cysteine-rich VLP protein, partial [Clostridium fessum]